MHHSFEQVMCLGTTVDLIELFILFIDSCLFLCFFFDIAGWQTGYRSHHWMLSGGTYLQISFGNLTLVNSIHLTVPIAFAAIRTIQLGYSLDGQSFAIDTVKYAVNGSSSYSVPLSKPLFIRYLRIYIIDVIQPSDLLTKTSGFILNITGLVNSTTATIAGK
jgi:hypothetical protein